MIALLCLVLPAVSDAATVLLKDETKLDALSITESGEQLTVKTKYGDLAVNKSDVSNLEELGFGGKSVNGPKTDGLEFISEVQPDASVKVDYFSNKEKIATQLFTQDGVLLNQEGKIHDGTYNEYYSDGKLKKEKTIIDSQNNGTFKTFYPDGVMQSEAYFIHGKMNGAYKIYTNSGKLLIERNFVEGVLNGYSRDYDDNGNLKAQILYVNGEMRYGQEPAKAVEAKINNSPEVRMQAREYEKMGSFFLAGELFSVGGANKEWTKNFNAAVDYLSNNFDYVSGELTTYPGIGATLGATLGKYNDSPLYLAASYVKGPSAEMDVTITDSYYGSGSYTEEIETSYYRFMLGYRLTTPMRENSFFILDANVGYGGGAIESEWSTYVSGLGRDSGSDEETWSGLTWSIGPSFSWVHPSYTFELGVRYSAFPDLKDSDKYSDVKWRPFSINFGLLF
jgi:antitoxin component YwqK of YwqJK toxin-antitoxin module